jgi:hypothetical protein
VVWDHRILRSLPAAMADSGDKICRPGGVFARGRRGEMERRGRATYRHREESKRTGNKEDLRRSNRRARLLA